MRTRVQKWGNSLALRIPKAIATKVGLQNGSPVEISLADGKLVVTHVAKPKTNLRQLLAQVTEQNLHHGVDSGAATGTEAW
jgi:antitoxin MazE